MITFPDMAGFPSPPRRTPSRTSLSSLQSDRSQGPPPTRPRKSSRRVRKDGTMSSGSESMSRGGSQQSASSGAETSGIDSDGGRSPLPGGLTGDRFMASQWTASPLETEGEGDRETLVASTSKTVRTSPTSSPHRAPNEPFSSQTPTRASSPGCRSADGSAAA